MFKDRIIEFRGKRIDNGQWVYGYYFKTPLTAENFEADSFQSGNNRDCISDEDGCVFEIDIDTLGQYTGFTDVRNAKIYEGDIDAHGFVVIFLGGRFLLLDKDGGSEDLFGERDEIVGNFIDNKDLMENN